MISWLCFEWQTDCLPDFAGPESPLVLREATKADADGVLNVVRTSFTVDASWGDICRLVAAKMTDEVHRVFAKDPVRCLVISHGTRVVGASILGLEDTEPYHLISGPCILHEYRNRGLGTVLLASSLQYLHNNGVRVAKALTRSQSITARFVYSKFGSISHLLESDPLKISAA